MIRGRGAAISYAAPYFFLYHITFIPYITRLRHHVASHSIVATNDTHRNCFTHLWEGCSMDSESQNLANDMPQNSLSPEDSGKAVTPDADGNKQTQNAPDSSSSYQTAQHEDGAQPSTDAPHVSVIHDGDKTYHIIGTAHVSEQSRQEVAKLIQEIHPDKVCVELCQERYDSFYDTEKWKKLDIFQVIRKGKFLYLLANLAISAYQRRMGATLGIKPGAELIGAAEEAKRNNAEVVLIDRNIHITLKRTWGNLGFFTKCKLLGAILDSLFEDDESKEETSKEIENLKKDANLSAMMEEFATQFPQVHQPLIDERDRYLVSKMRECGGKNVIAVVGAGHVPGMNRYYKEPIDTKELEKLPKPSVLWTLIKWLIPLVLIGGIAYGVCAHGTDTLEEMLMAWILPNSIVCFIFAILALAHPLTILASIIVSPITSTTPVIGAGIVLGLLEAWLRKPTVEDCENLQNVHTFSDFYKNRFTHVLIVCMLTMIGSALGAYIGIALIVKILALLGM